MVGEGGLADDFRPNPVIQAEMLNFRGVSMVAARHPATKRPVPVRLGHDGPHAQRPLLRKTDIQRLLIYAALQGWGAR